MGIYSISGCPFALQIIYMKQLSEENNPFLTDLDDKLDTRKLVEVLKLADKPHRIDISAYVPIITRANKARLKELIMINNPTLEQIIEESSLPAR